MSTRMTMTKGLAVLMLGAAGMTAALPADARRRPDQNDAYEQTRLGQIKPLREIENRVVPRMGGARYLGPELYPDRYRLKFMENGSVIWVDVDARSGAIIGRTGN